MAEGQKRGKKGQGSIEEVRPGVHRLRYQGPPKEDGSRSQLRATVNGTVKEAQKELRRLMVEVDTGKRAAPTKKTVAALLRSWLKIVKLSTRPTSFERYEEIVDVHLIPKFGPVTLDKLTQTDIQDFVDDLLTSGNRKSKGKPLARQTVHHIGRTFRQALQWGAEQDRPWLTKSPAAKIVLPQPGKQEMAALTEREIGRLFTAAAGSHLYMLAVLGIATGMRRGEMLALRWGDVDEATGRTTICRSLEETKEGPPARFKDCPKNGRFRVVVLPASALRALDRHKGEQSKAILEFGRREYKDHDLIIAQPDGTPWWPTNISRQFERLLNQIDKPAATLHSLRHTFARQALRRGVDIRVVQRALGHSTVAITLDRYGCFMGDEQEVAAVQLEDVFRVAGGG